MPELDRRAIVDTFIGACVKLELDPGRDRLECHAGMPYFVFPAGRDRSVYTHEFFALDTPVSAAIELSSAVAGESPHIIDAIGLIEPDAFDQFAAAGYGHWGAWSLMVRPLSARVSEPAAARAAELVDELTERRVLGAVLEAGDPAIRSGRDTSPIPPSASGGSPGTASRPRSAAS